MGENKLILVVYISLAHKYCASSLVKQAYDPTGDNKVMGHWADLFGPDSDGLSTGLPIPSRELSVWTRAKACGLNALRAKETA